MAMSPVLDLKAKGTANDLKGSASTACFDFFFFLLSPLVIKNLRTTDACSHYLTNGVTFNAGFATEWSL